MTKHDITGHVRRREMVELVGYTGVIYNVSTVDILDENIRTCNVAEDRDLLLQARGYLYARRGPVFERARP